MPTKTRTKRKGKGPIRRALGFSKGLVGGVVSGAVDAADRGLGKVVGNPKPPEEMTAGEINKALDKLDAISSKLAQEAIDAGMGHLRMSEIEASGHPVGEKYRELWKKRVPLRIEVERRYGPGAPSRLPKGFGPIRRANGLLDIFRTKTTIKHVKTGEGRTSHGLMHKGHQIYASRGGFVVPTIDNEAVLDTKQEAKKFIDFWTKKNPAKFDRCVKKVKKQRGDVNAYAVCTAARTRGNPAQQRYTASAFHGYSEAEYERARGLGSYTFSGTATKLQKGFPATTILKHGKRSLVRVDRYGEAYYGWINTADLYTQKKFVEEFGYQPEVGKRGNPEGAAASMYESFHGKPSEEVVEVEEEEHYHGNLAGLAQMIGLKIRTVSGFDWTVEFEDVLLASNEDGTHLYLVGGDQSLDLKKAKLETNKDSLIVGEAWCIAYHTEKDFDNFKPMDYIHGFGPEKDQAKLSKDEDLWNDAQPPKEEVFGTGELPTLRYDCLNEKIYLDGGKYKIDRPLIGTSGGIED
jgi:hypothetical protein